MLGQPIHLGQEFFLFGFLTIGDETDRLSQNFGKKLPLLAALSPKWVQFSRVENVYKTFIIEKLQDSKIVPYKAVVVGCNTFFHYLLPHFKAFLDLFSSTVYVLTYTHLFVFHVVKVGSFHELLTFGNRKVSQMWDLVILLWTFLYGPLDKTAKLICFLTKETGDWVPMKTSIFICRKKKSILFDEQVVGEHSLPLRTKSSHNMHVLVVGYYHFSHFQLQSHI